MIKISKIYLKIFLSFLLVLFISEIVILGLFYLIAGRAFQDRHTENAAARMMILKEIVQDKIGTETNESSDQYAALETFINHYADNFQARVWLVDATGAILFETHAEPLPEAVFPEELKLVRDFGSSRVYRPAKGLYSYLVTISIDLPHQETGSLNLLYMDRGPSQPEKGFAWGLFIIGLITALLCIPVSRLISKPIKQLQQSALRIAEGDLGHRADIASRDEIGDLGLAFNRMANQLERMIRGGRELTANVSHELRSPLARIRVAEEIMREKCEKAGFRDGALYLNEIQEEIIELDRLIDRMLYLSKLDVHENHSPSDDIDLTSMIKGVADRYDSAVKRKEIKLILELEKEAWLLGGHETLLTALSNVMDNAIKFSEPGGTIKVKLLIEENDLRVEFINPFPEMGREELVKIFEPFYRSGTVPESTGAGLGLAIVKKIIISHGGEIEAANTEDGFMIRILLPRRTEQAGKIAIFTP